MPINQTMSKSEVRRRFFVFYSFSGPMLMVLEKIPAAFPPQFSSIFLSVGRARALVCVCTLDNVVSVSICVCVCDNLVCQCTCACCWTLCVRVCERERVLKQACRQPEKKTNGQTDLPAGTLRLQDLAGGRFSTKKEAARWANFSVNCLSEELSRFCTVTHHSDITLTVSTSTFPHSPCQSQSAAQVLLSFPLSVTTFSLSSLIYPVSRNLQFKYFSLFPQSVSAVR